MYGHKNPQVLFTNVEEQLNTRAITRIRKGITDLYLDLKGVWGMFRVFGVKPKMSLGGGM